MTGPSDKESPWVNEEQPLVAHLIEFRRRFLWATASFLLVWLAILPFYQEIYTWFALPLIRQLPAGTTMVAIDVVSPFFVPLKLSFFVAFFLAVPAILYQVWGFIAPGLYKSEQRVIVPLIISSSVLFYIGIAFAYFIVFPLIFSFMVAATPEGVTMMTDINRYLSFALLVFLAFGTAFEVPVATFILNWTGISTPEEMVQARPYVIVGAFFIGMIITPPDAFSQTLLAIPMWLLFELGVWISKRFLEARARSVETSAPSTEIVANADAVCHFEEPAPPRLPQEDDTISFR